MRLVSKKWRGYGGGFNGAGERKLIPRPGGPDPLPNCGIKKGVKTGV
jgi:hypothetical protein